MPEAEQKHKSRKIGDLFSDYKTNSNIKYAYIQALNVNKKTNTLGIILGIDEYVEIKEIWFLEKFLKERFGFSNIDMTMKYTDQVQTKGIKEEWKNIICYMAHKFPLAKPMLLMNAEVESTQKEITVNMHIKGAEFLKAKKTDQELANVIQKLFGKKYKITLTENITKEEMQKIVQKAKEAEEKEVNKIIEHIEMANKQLEQENLKSLEDSYVGEEDPNYMSPESMPYMVEEAPKVAEDENQELILGKQTKAKENKVKIKDITPSDTRITLEGRVSNLEKRMTKSEKVLLIFELYDGTGKITCKSFTVPEDSQNVITKLEEANTVKIIGKAGVILSSCFKNMDIDYVITVETKGIPLAYEVARNLGVQLIIARRDTQVTEGPTVTINYVSGTSGRLQQMSLSKKSMKPGSKSIFIDDFMKGGGTAQGIKDLLKEFDNELVGIGVLVDNKEVEKKLVDEYVSIVELKAVDKSSIIDIHPSPRFSGK